MSVRVLPWLAAACEFPLPAAGLDRTGYLRLDLSEGIGPPPPPVRAALEDLSASDGFSAYPDDSILYSYLSDYAGIAPSHLLVTNGSDHGIQIILRAFLAPGDRLQIMDPSFPIYAFVARTLGAEVHTVPLASDFAFGLAEFLRALADGPRLAVLVNPNNPTGTLIPAAAVREVVQAAGEREIPVIVDEAYFEFSHETAVSMVADHPNLLITRTLSKAFGLAGLRLGYVIAQPPLIAELRKLRLPFDVNAFAIRAAAAHLSHPDRMKAYVADILGTSKPMLEQFLIERRMLFYPSAANFILVRLAQRDRIVAALKERRILVAPQGHPRLRDAMRVAIAPSSRMPGFLSRLSEVLPNATADGA